MEFLLKLLYNLKNYTIIRRIHYVVKGTRILTYKTNSHFSPSTTLLKDSILKLRKNKGGLSMNGKLIEVRGKKLYVEIHGENHNNAVLYLHGGPGESCYDFSYHQAKKLSASMKLILIDQRGVCRSELIQENESFGLDDIIHDCEALRIQLGIKQWSLIGHSFGGFLALKYAFLFPLSIEKIIFEGPTFDFKLTTLGLLKKTAKIAENHGYFNLKSQCISVLESVMSAKELEEVYQELSSQLGERRMEIYTFNFKNPTDYSLYSQEEWDQFDYNAEIHYNRLKDEGEIYKTLLPLLRKIETPMLLLLGKHDPVTCEKQIQEFNNGKDRNIYVFENSGHTPHYEEANVFTNVVTDYIHSRVN